jgi:hypothetical protein
MQFIRIHSGGAPAYVNASHIASIWACDSGGKDTSVIHMTAGKDEMIQADESPDYLVAKLAISDVVSAVASHV